MRCWLYLSLAGSLVLAACAPTVPAASGTLTVQTVRVNVPATGAPAAGAVTAEAVGYEVVVTGHTAVSGLAYLEVAQARYPAFELVAAGEFTATFAPPALGAATLTVDTAQVSLGELAAPQLTGELTGVEVIDQTLLRLTVMLTATGGTAWVQASDFALITSSGPASPVGLAQTPLALDALSPSVEPGTPARVFVTFAFNPLAEQMTLEFAEQRWPVNVPRP